MVINWVSKKGGRIQNEDAIGKAKAKRIVCVVVADGLGGHNGGKLASHITVNTILDSFKNNPGFSKSHLEEYITRAKDAVVERAKQDPELLRMSSTVVVLLVKGRRAMWANVGDTRLYRFQSSMLSEVTEDHSVAFLDFMDGHIEYNDIRQSLNQNKLTSVVGLSMDGVNYSNEVGINAATAFLVCTDGWWEYITEEEMEETLKDSPTCKVWLEKMLEIHNSKAPDDCDNYTALVGVI